ncbi:MAG: type II secretion system protein GspE, partial [Syntrophobacterales bacterium CG_4_9_14_3_um_filter_49_8]
MNLSIESGDNIVAILDYIISGAIIEGASDIHIEPKEKMLTVRYRVDGILRHKTDIPIYLAPNLVSRIKVLCGLDIAEKRRHQDGRIEARVNNIEVDLRVSVYVSSYGENVVIRILHRKTQFINLDALGLSPANRINYQRVLDQPSGIILVTGPTGCGKTTTLYASVNYLNDGQKAIITVEDPVEYIMEGVVQGQLDTKIGQTYMDFLKS